MKTPAKLAEVRSPDAADLKTAVGEAEAEAAVEAAASVADDSVDLLVGAAGIEAEEMELDTKRVAVFCDAWEGLVNGKRSDRRKEDLQPRR